MDDLTYSADYTLADSLDEEQSSQLSIAAGTTPSPEEGARIAKLAETLKVEPALVSSNPGYYQKLAETVPQGTDWGLVVRRSPRLAQLLSDSVHMSMAKDDIPAMSALEDTTRALNPRDQLSWGSVIGHNIAIGAEGTIGIFANAAAGIWGGGRALMGLNASEGYIPQLALAIHDDMTSHMSELEKGRRTFIQNVTGTATRFASDPTMYFPPVAAGRLAGKGVATAAGSTVEAIMAKAIATGAKEDVALASQLTAKTLNAAAMTMAVQSSTMTLQQRLLKKQAEGKELSHDLGGDLAEATAMGVLAFATGKLSGITNEMRLALPAQDISAGMIASDVLRDLGANTIQGSGGAIISGARDGNISATEVVKAGLEAGLSTLPLAAPNIIHMFRQGSQKIVDSVTQGAAKAQRVQEVAHAIETLNQSKYIARMDPTEQIQYDAIKRMLPELGTIQFERTKLQEHFAGDTEALIKQLGGTEANGTVSFDGVKFLQAVRKDKSHVEFLLDNHKLPGDTQTLAEVRKTFEDLPKLMDDLQKNVTAAMKEPRLPTGAIDDSSKLADSIYEKAVNALKGASVPNTKELSKNARSTATTAALAYRSMADRLNLELGEAKYTPSSLHELYPISFESGGKRISQDGNAIRGEYNTETRSILFRPDADASTFTHELGHHFLEIMKEVSKTSDHFKSELIGVSDWISKNAEHVIETAGESEKASINAAGGAEWLRNQVKDMTNLDSSANTAVHEYFARGFEHYIATGKAPTPKLKKLFARMMEFMADVYRSLKTLNVNMSEEVTKTFDRFLTLSNDVQTELETRAGSSPYFATKPEGMSDAAWGSLLAASVDLRTKHVERMMERIRKELKEEGKIAVNQRIADQAAQLAHAPVYEAFAEIADGKHYDGSPAVNPGKFNAEGLFELVGEANARWLYSKGLVEEGGKLNADVYAREKGFTDATDMVNQMAAAKPFSEAVQSAVRPEEVVKDLADEYMKDRGRGRLAEAEMAAIEEMKSKGVSPAVDATKELIEFPERIKLGKYEREFMKAEIATAIRTMAREELRPAAMESRADRLADVAYRQLARGEYDRAYDSKRTEMRLREMADQVREIKKDLDRAEKTLSSAITPKSLDAYTQGGKWVATTPDGTPHIFETMAEANDFKASQDKNLGVSDPRTIVAAVGNLSAAVQEISAKYGFGEQNPQLAPMSVNDIVKTLVDPVMMIPNSVRERTTPVSSKYVGIGELLDIAGLIDQITKQSEDAGKIKQAGITRSLNEVRTQIIDFTKTQPAFKPMNSFAEGVARAVDSLSTLSTLVRALDGGKTIGAFSKTILEPLNLARAWKAKENDIVSKEFEKLREKAGLSSWGIVDRPLRIPGVNKAYTRRERIELAGLWGRKAGRERIMNNEGITKEQMQLILNTLTDKDIAYIQGVYKLNDRFKQPIIEAKQRQGEPTPQFVTGIPYEINGKQIDGGMWHIGYLDSAASNMTAEQLMSGTADIARPSDTYLEHTAETVTGLQLDLRGNVNVQAMRKTIHDLALREWAISTYKILDFGKNENSNAAVRDAMRLKYGTGIINELKKNIDGIIAGPPGADPLSKGLDMLRVNVTNATLAFNLFSAPTQILGFANSIAHPDIGLKHMVNAIVQWATDANARRLVESDVHMQARAGVADASMHDALAAMDKLPAGKWIAKYGYGPMRFFQKLVDQPTYLAAYNRHMEESGGNHAESQAVAIRAVRDSQAGGETEDVPTALRNPLMKTLFMFGSYKNAILNQNISAWRHRKEGMKGVLESSLVSGMTIMLPAMLYAVSKAALRGDQLGPDDWSNPKTDAEELAKMAIGETMGLIPILSLASSKVTGIPDNNMAVRSVGSAIKAGGDVYQWATGEGSPPTLKDSLRALQWSAPGSLIGNEQVIKTLEGMNEWMEGRSDIRAIPFGPVPANKR